MHNTGLIITGFACSVLLLVILTVRWRCPAFFALLMASYLAGFIFGMEPAAILERITEGFGSTLGDIGLTIVLGALLGVVLEGCGATAAIAKGMTRALGGRFPGLALAITGYIVSIPIYCDSGFIILNSIRQYLAQKHHISPVFLSTVLGCSLYATHTLVPPTPGPLAAMSNLRLSDQIPIVISMGLLFSLLAVNAAFAWALLLKSLTTKNPLVPQDCVLPDEEPSPPFLLAILPIIVPIFLITIGGLSGAKAGSFGYWLSFLGHPVNALLTGLLCCWPLLAVSGAKLDFSRGLETGGKIVLVVGCGGAFGYILRGSGISEMLVGVPGLSQWGLVLPFATAAIIKTAEGSATVALITASAMIEPLLPALGLDSTSGRLLALFSCGGGAMTVAHVNDSLFWVIAEFTGMDTATALKSLTVATFFQGMAVLVGVEIMALVML
ncbi:GntP family permease [Endozoicomonas sp. Mp262]|uniref:GntP family permease n=1 Tax=Endozoicomonas sp. Mp262 TaxID=2919499 RepID=UPI0021D95624